MAVSKKPRITSHARRLDSWTSREMTAIVAVSPVSLVDGACMAKSEACLRSGRDRDEEFQTRPEPWDDGHCGCIGIGPARNAPIAGAGTKCCCRAYPILLPGTNAHDPAGRAPHCTRAR